MSFVKDFLSLFGKKKEERGAEIARAVEEIQCPQNTVDEMNESEERNNPEFVIEEDTLVKYNGARETVVVPDGIRVVGKEAFKENNSIKRVFLSEGITDVEDEAFVLCANIEEIVLPESLRHIGTSAFDACGSLQRVKLPQNLQHIGDYAFALSGLVELSIPDSVEYVGEGAFSRCQELTKIVFPKHTVLTSTMIFRNCDNLTELNIPGTQSVVGQFCFWGCKNLKSLTIQEGVRKIEDCAFWECEKLQEVVLPSLLECAESAFDDCNNIVSIEVPESINGIVFKDSKDSIKVIRASDNWKARYKQLFNNLEEENEIFKDQEVTTSAFPDEERLGLSYYTRFQADPHGKPRVFFASHPKEASIFFEQIADILLKAQDCAIYYEKLNSESLESENVYSLPWEELESYLAEMQLIVVPVTTRLLTKPNRFMDQIFPFAEKQHVPVLPLMMESHIDELFRKRFGQLQYLKPNQNDATELPFMKKLQDYLSPLLVGDELAERVRQAFDAYIFLSYRKKDRLYAQKLMRMIHEEEKYRDIAIWYDEYLTPGEDFNIEIESALNKGKLFALVVTPSLLEEGNYIMRLEYPAAIQAKKPILPALMVPTDLNRLSELYRGIPVSVDMNDEGTRRVVLENILKDIAVSKSCDNSIHNYLIGLAYLNGIDVEVNAKRGVELISNAADTGLLEAMEMLVVLFREGKGVERDFKLAASWQEKVVERTKAIWMQSGALSDLNKLWSAELMYSTILEVLWDVEGLEELYKDMSEQAKLRAEKGDKQAIKIDLPYSYIKLAKNAKEKGKLQEAERWLEKAKSEIEKNTEKEDDYQLDNTLSLCLQRLGDIKLEVGKWEEANNCYQEAIVIREKWFEEGSSFLIPPDEPGGPKIPGKNTPIVDISIGANIDHASYYQKLGDLATNMGDYETAGKYYNSVREYLENIYSGVTEKELYALFDEDTRRALPLIYERLGTNELRKGNIREAKQYHLKALGMREKFVEELPTFQLMRDVAVSYGQLGNIFKEEEQYQEAREYYEHSFAVLKQLFEDTNSIISREDLSRSYCQLGLLEQKRKNYHEAKDCFEKSRDIVVDLCKEFQQASYISMLADNDEYLADTEERLGNPQKATLYLDEEEKLLGHLLSMNGKQQSPEYQAQLASYYETRFYVEAAMRKKDSWNFEREAYAVWNYLSNAYPSVERYKMGKRRTALMINRLRQLGLNINVDEAYSIQTTDNSSPLTTQNN